MPAFCSLLVLFPVLSLPESPKNQGVGGETRCYSPVSLLGVDYSQFVTIMPVLGLFAIGLGILVPALSARFSQEC